MRISSTSLIGMQSLSASLAATAHHISNMGKDGFNPDSIVPVESGPDGQPRPNITLTNPLDGSGTQIEKEMARLVGTQSAFESNAVMIRTDEDLSGIIVDLSA